MRAVCPSSPLLSVAIPVGWLVGRSLPCGSFSHCCAATVLLTGFCCLVVVSRCVYATMEEFPGHSAFAVSFLRLQVKIRWYHLNRNERALVVSTLVGSHYHSPPADSVGVQLL